MNPAQTPETSSAIPVAPGTAAELNANPSRKDAMTHLTYTPSADLLAVLGMKADSLAADAGQWAESAVRINADLATMDGEQAADAAGLAELQRQANEVDARMADRRQRISRAKQAGEAAAATAAKLNNDAEYLRGQIDDAHAAEIDAAHVAEEAPAGPPQPAAPARQAATADDPTPRSVSLRCPTCLEEIQQDSLGWHHAADKSAVCGEGSGSSPVVAERPAQVPA